MDTLANGTVELRVPCKVQYIPVIRTLVTYIANRLAFPASDIDDIRVAVCEACTNVVRHAYGKSISDTAEILITLSPDSDGLSMSVIDTGRGLREIIGTPLKRRRRDGGYGLLLIRNLMDEVELDTGPDRGTTVRMEKRLGGRGQVGAGTEN